MTDEQDPPLPAVTITFRRLVALGRPVPGQSDDDRAARLDRLAGLTARLVRLPAATLPEVEQKLTILAGRLRADLDPDRTELVLTYALAESARDDLRRLLPDAAAAGDPAEGGVHV